jgi:uncharacterized membrane protein YqiK
VRTLADAERDRVKAETEAEAYRQRTMAEANRDTVNFQVEADANKARTIAQAEAEAEKVKAEADREAKKHEADGDAYAARTVAEADAEAINARADALSEGNQALIAANKLIEQLPSLVSAAAKGIEGSHLTVLNGSEGVNQVLTGLVGQGVQIYEALRHSVAAQASDVASSNGASSAPAISSSDKDSETGSTPRGKPPAS